MKLRSNLPFAVLPLHLHNITALSRHRCLPVMLVVSSHVSVSRGDQPCCTPVVLCLSVYSWQHWTPSCFWNNIGHVYLKQLKQARRGFQSAQIIISLAHLGKGRRAQATVGLFFAGNYSCRCKPHFRAYCLSAYSAKETFFFHRFVFFFTFYLLTLFYTLFLLQMLL